uniref:Uncharacterized protein n=1 Tax=Strigamia maritima TaxID=126957 RepID=T1IRI9_STRMM
MGKDQELLDAARNGNLAVVEKIVSQRSKRSGPLASLRRGPGANVQDNSGYTPLHHAALNGHRDVVSMLLLHEASTNIVDNKGSTPLHLAAWTGNTDIVRMILMQGLVPSNVNLANHDRETPLHSAAQYGHTEVVSLLLQHNADPIIRNNRDETPLDLAAQYGRLETVELLCRTHPELLGENAAVRTHSPLHLASRNGHRHVVQVLLRYGMGVNVHTDGGSALHEAALFGKVDVVRVLLDHGVNLDATDSRRRNVFDILDDLKTNISQEIAAIITTHQKFAGTEDYENANRSNAYHSIRRSRGHLDETSPTYYCRGSSSPNGHCYQMVPKPRLVEDHRLSGYISKLLLFHLALLHFFYSSYYVFRGCLDPYQIPPPPRSLDSSQEGDSDMSMTSSSYQTPPPPRDLEAYYNQQRISLPSDSDGNVLYQVPPPPRDGKRFSDPQDQKKGQWHQIGNYSYIPMAPIVNSGKGSLKAPQKPPRKNMSPHSPTKFQLAAPGGPYEFLCMATSGDCETGGYQYYNEDHSVAPGSEYVDMRMRHSYVPSYENHCPLYSNEYHDCVVEGCDNSISPRGSGSPYENVSMDSQGHVIYMRKKHILELWLRSAA